MNDAKLVNIARLMTTYNFEIEQLPDKLKCTQCKLVLKDACYLACCCKYCLVCVNDMMARGSEFCSGGSEECGESLLSRHQSDYLANKGVSRLVVKCPHDGCVHKCQLVNIEEHLRECQRNSEECPFRELGCTQDKLAAEEMGGHLQTQNRRHSEILIEMIANINREIEMLKQRDVASSKEIEMLKQRDAASSKEIEMIKQRDEASSKEIEMLKQIDVDSNKEIDMLKHGLVLKDEQIRSIMDQMIHLQNENKSIKNEIKLIKEEKEDLAGRVTILAEKIEQEIAERVENDELDSAKVIDYVDREIAVVTLLIGSNKDELVSEIQSLRGNIGSRNQDVQLIKDDICSVKQIVHSVQALVGLGQFDASIVWLIDIDVHKTHWGWKESEYFTGEVHPYKYRLASGNDDMGTARAELCIRLQIYAGPNDGQLAWPFLERVVITVTDMDRREACRSISLQCRIERPRGNGCRVSDPFKFSHSELKNAGLNLRRGVRVSCVIVPYVD